MRRRHRHRIVRTEHLPAEEVAFGRWRAERWMKLRHPPAALRHDPGYVLRKARRKAAHAFGGSTLHIFLGLEAV